MGCQWGSMDRQDYITKAKHLLEQPTYQPIPSGPTNEKYKTKLVNILRKIKGQSGMDDTPDRRMYSTKASSPQVLWSSQNT